MATMKIGFLVNPIAGMGGRVGLKGTDGVLDKALKLGAKAVAKEKAAETLAAFNKLLAIEEIPEIEWLTCSGAMGADALKHAGFEKFEVLHEPEKNTTRDDTLKAAGEFLKNGAGIILFCGGDGTARDICEIVGEKIPILGIPSGVKMYSGIFGISPARTADILAGFLKGELKPTQVDVLDLDEDKYRKGEWVARLFGTALTPYEPTLVQASKMMFSETTEEGILEEIAEYLQELAKAKPDTLFILGPGSTLEFMGEKLGIDKTLLGIDAVLGKKLVGKDLNEAGLLKLLANHKKVKLLLSPIGAQGFVLGRGNLQLSPEVIRKIKRENIMVISTPAKLARTPVLRFDTGDAELDKELAGKGYFNVVVGYRISRLVKVEL
jgi:predicted polyphosphate/ATP-dependent NAD kinase